MPSPTPTSDLALLVANLETLIASSVTFQAACLISGDDPAANVTAARAFIAWLGEAAPVKRPFAWIKLKLPATFTGEHSGGGGFWPDFELLVLLELDAVAADTLKDRQIRWLNFIGGVIKDLGLLAKTAGMLWATRFTLAESMMQDPKEAASYNQATLEVKVW
jgi:hypothetical protein